MDLLGIFPNLTAAQATIGQADLHYVLMDIANVGNQFSVLATGVPVSARVIIFANEELYYVENLGSGLEAVFMKGSDALHAADLPEVPSREGAGPIHLDIQPNLLHMHLDDTYAARMENALGDRDGIVIRPQNAALQMGIGTSTVSNSIFVKSEARISRIPLDQLLYVEAQKDYVLLHTRERPYRVLNSMKRITQRLGNVEFMRVHRSYIIRLDKIVTIEGEYVQLQETATKVPIGPSYKSELMDRLRLI